MIFKQQNINFPISCIYIEKKKKNVIKSNIFQENILWNILFNFSSPLQDYIQKKKRKII